MILIVDDDAALGASLERVFRYAGYDAVSVRGGLEALSMLHLRKPTLIVLDLVMPSMDGMTVLCAIRKDPAFDEVPILVYTSEISDLRRSQAMAVGAQDFVVKGTVGWDALVARVAKLIEKQGPQIRLAE